MAARAAAGVGVGRVTTARRAFPWLVVAGVLVAALSLRAPILAVTPVLRDIARDHALDAATVSLLTTLPVLMFAAFTPLAALVIRRAGLELALLSCLVAVAAGTLIRALPGYGWMLVGMAVIGVGITVGNVVVPVIIGRDVPPHAVSTVTAAYTAALNAGSLVTTLTTAAIAEVTGWPLALLLWISLTVLGLALWGLHLWRRHAAGVRAAGPSAVELEITTATVPVIPAEQSRRVLRQPIVWLLLATFACQTAAYYGMSTWLPAILGDLTGADAAAAGALASLFQGVAIIGPFIVPALARRLPLVVPAMLIAACWLAFAGGMLLAPQLFVLWVVFGGIAHAGGFVVIFTAMVDVSRSPTETATMSAVVQGGAYVAGAASAPVIGLLHDATGGWAVPQAAIVALTVGFAVCLLAAVARVRR
ncbi:MFS transporter [Microbacterium sp. NPDC096154]|uniref:MFS transporter n=1 Tax=Microbacterium sp. NPDC096154 TaxID=3155549 RepID=UPI00332281A4